MSDYDPEFLNDEYFESPASVTPPEDLKLTVEVGLTAYSPNGLLGLIAQALLGQIGGRDKWAKRLEAHLVKLANDEMATLIRTEIVKVWRGETGIDFNSIVKKAAEEHMNEMVDSQGKKASPGNARQKRIEYIAAELVKESTAAAFKEAEAEWKQTTKNAIKETLAEVLASRLAKALPSPPELR